MTEKLVDGDLTLRRAVPADARRHRRRSTASPTSSTGCCGSGTSSRRGRGAGQHRAVRGRPGRRASDAPFRIVVGRARGRRREPATSVDVPASPRSSYFLRASARGRGLATRAVLLVVRLGFPRARRWPGCSAARATRTTTASSRAGRAGGLHLRGTSSDSSAAYPDGRRFDSLRLLVAAVRTGLRPAGHPGRRRLPHQHGDRGQRRPAPAAGRRARGVPGRVRRVDRAAGARRDPGQHHVGRHGVRRRRRPAPGRADRASSSSWPDCSSCPPTRAAASAAASSAT